MTGTTRRQSLPFWRLQRQSMCRPRILALVPWTPGDREDERKWTKASGVLYIPWIVHHKLLLQDQAPAQGFLAPSKIKALAPARPHPDQALITEKRTPHSLIPECGLRYRPLTGMLQDEETAKEVPQIKTSWKTTDQHQQHVPTRPCPTFCNQSRKGTG